MYAVSKTTGLRRLVPSLIFVFVICASFLASGQSAFASSWQIPDNIPHGVPYTVNGSTYQHYIMWHSGDSSYADDWQIVYTNNDNFYLGSDWYVHYSYSDPDAYVCMTTAGQNPTWNCSVSTGHFSDTPNNILFPSWSVFGLVCAGTGYSDHTVFVQSSSPFTPPISSGVPSYGTVCQDLWPTGTQANFPDVFMERLVTDSAGIISGVSAPGSEVIIDNSDFGSDYMEVPNPITDPTGFIGAVFTNFFIFLYKGFIPPDGYLTEKLADVSTAWNTDQPGLASINTAFADGIVSLSSPTSLAPISIGALHVGGTTTSSVTFFDSSTMPSGIFDTAKTLISAFMYFGVAFWVVREMSTILSA